MIQLPIYMDNHATTRVDPRVMEAMSPYFSEDYGNAGSSHQFGFTARDAVESARKSIAAAVGARPKEIVFTSGATESNNLAIRGVAEKHAERGKHLVSVCTEHPSVLDPLEKLRRRGYEVTLLPVVESPDDRAGRLLPELVEEAIRPDTVLVSVMLANNEIGTIQPLEEIGQICRSRGVLLHTDATQAVGRIAVDVEQLQVDLMSFTAHKIYGPKGVGALYVRRRNPQVRMSSLIDGGGQERGLRSGTLNTPGIVGFARALELCLEEMPREQQRIRGLRDRMFAELSAGLSGVALNGPALVPPELRIAGNLNLSFAQIDGEALLMSMKDVAVSSGSACTSADPEPSHVLRNLGLGHELIHGGIRLGLGRFNTVEEVDFVVRAVTETVTRLRNMAGPSIGAS